MSTHGAAPNGSPRKVFLPLENNPETLTPLAHELGLRPDLAFHDLYSFTDRDLIDLIPRPALALLFIWPSTTEADAWHRAEVEEERRAEERGEKVSEEGRVVWFRQDVVNNCGLMGLIHCCLNVPSSLTSQLPPVSASATTNAESSTTTTSGINDASASTSTTTNPTPSPPLLTPSSPLSSLRHSASLLPHKDIDSRAALIVNDPTLEVLHHKYATQGQTAPPPLGEDPGHAFIAFVMDDAGGVWEMDGGRVGAKFLGVVVGKGAEGGRGDLLDEEVLEMSVRPYLRREMGFGQGKDGRGGGGGSGNFSCTVLAPAE